MSQSSAWRCSVCGYVHRGDQPPAMCPICGAGREEFQAYVEPEASPLAATAWRCLNCNYEQAGADAPEVCPVCGAAKDRFEPEAPAPAVEQAGKDVGRILIVGAGIAGISAVEAIRRSAPDAEIVLISKETEGPYYRLNLTRYLAGEVGTDDLPLRPREWFAEQRIDFRAGLEVAELSPANRTATLRGGEAIAFDTAILAMGAHPFVPPFGGATLDGVHCLRTLDNAQEILAAAKAGEAGVVIGGGLLGLETAGALAKRGADVTLLESHAYLMPRQLNRTAGELLAARVRELGINLLTEARTDQIVGDETVAGVALRDGRMVSAGLVIVATGVRPNSYLARRAGLEVDSGVVVNGRLRTSAPHVLAAGDVAEHLGRLYGHWAASQYQGGIAGMNAVGVDAEFGGLPPSSTLKVMDVDVVSMGISDPEDGSYDVIEDLRDDVYRRFVFHDGGLVGAILFGDASVGSAARHAIETRTDLSALLASRPNAVDVADYFAAQ
ncbi:hypothetical protein LCGC14_0018930 [marine sediment metagenome]|uniref:Rubredoxin-like domain-containing protein n=1 Tax=marine sediment metagenome TaxID=412755 RepID=A0A0F9YGP3_9ZZZZ